MIYLVAITIIFYLVVVAYLLACWWNRPLPSSNFESTLLAVFWPVGLVVLILAIIYGLYSWRV